MSLASLLPGHSSTHWPDSTKMPLAPLIITSTSDIGLPSPANGTETVFILNTEGIVASKNSFYDDGRAESRRWYAKGFQPTREAQRDGYHWYISMAHAAHALRQCYYLFREDAGLEEPLKPNFERNIYLDSREYQMLVTHADWHKLVFNEKGEERMKLVKIEGSLWKLEANPAIIAKLRQKGGQPTG